MRVLLAVQMLADVAEAAGAAMTGNDFTLVVRNHNLTAELRAWTPDAQSVLLSIGSVLEDPLTSAQQDQENLRAIAHEFGKWAPRISEGNTVATIRLKKSPKTKRVINDSFANIMTAAASEAAPEVFRRHARTSVETPVLQVGRSSEVANEVRALVVIGGKPQTVRIEKSLEAEFAKAMTARELSRITIECPIVKLTDGSIRFAWKSARAIGIQTIEPLTGPKFLHAAKHVSKDSKARLFDAFGFGD